MDVSSMSIEELVRALDSPYERERKDAVARLRAELKASGESKRLVEQAGGVAPLISLLDNEDAKTMEHAAVCLQGLCLVPRVPPQILAAGGVGPLTRLLQDGTTPAKEAAAGALFALSLDRAMNEEVRREGGVVPLLSMLQMGSARGRTDACMVLFNISREPAGASEMLRAGAVDVLLHVLSLHDDGLEDKAMAVLANLCRLKETCDMLRRLEQGSARDAVAMLVEVLESGSVRAKEDAVMALLMLARSDISDPRFDYEGSCIARIVDLGAGQLLRGVMSSGSRRAKNKSAALLEILSASSPRQALRRTT